MLLPKFKAQDRVQVDRLGSSYHNLYGTVVEAFDGSHSVLIDGHARPMRFWDNELIEAPASPVPPPELSRTQAYIRELDEDTKQLFTTASLYPQGSTVQKDVQAFAAHQAKIVYNLKLVLHQDGVTVWEAEDGGK